MTDWIKKAREMKEEKKEPKDTAEIIKDQFVPDEEAIEIFKQRIEDYQKTGEKVEFFFFPKIIKICIILC
jgi:adenylate kinase family enzyme